MPMWWSGIQMQPGKCRYCIFLTHTQRRSSPSKQSFCRCRTISVSTQVQGGDFNLYEGMRCHGVPLVTISRGRLVCENGVFMCAEGSGKFYSQRTFPDYLYKKMVQREKVCFYFNLLTTNSHIHRHEQQDQKYKMYHLIIKRFVFQAQAYKGVDRDPYSGDVAKVATTMKKELGLGPVDGDAASKGANRAHQGVRDLHESSFSLSGWLSCSTRSATHYTGMTALLNCLCVCVFFPRVPSWWPYPQKVLSSDPGSTWWSLQWYLVISWDDPQPFKPLCFVYLWATRKTALIFHHRFFLKEKWENKFQHCSVIRRMIRDLPKRLVRNELTS